jgi:Recombinase
VGSGELWGAVPDFLANPAYAGAFVYGRSRTEKYLADDGRVRRRTVQVPVEQWSVCIPNHHPGYVSWDEYRPPASGCERT